MKITDEIIKKKHKEFNARVSAALGQKQNTVSPIIQRLRQLVHQSKTRS